MTIAPQKRVDARVHIGFGWDGSVIRSEKRTVSAVTSEIRSHGSVNSSASRPKPGMIAVQPQVGVPSSSSSTARVSPGAAPLT